MNNVTRIATQTHTRTRPDGSTASWHQENEAACMSKGEAVAVIQRTIDFWVPRLAEDLKKRDNGLTPEDALVRARGVFRGGFKESLTEAFPARWGVTVDDLNFEVDY